jgi:hypothetical protein
MTSSFGPVTNQYSRVGSWAFASDNDPNALPGYTQANRYSQGARPTAVTHNAYPTHGIYPTSSLRTDHTGAVPCEGCPQSHENAKRAMYEAYMAQLHQQRRRGNGMEGYGYMEGYGDDNGMMPIAGRRRSLADIFADPEVQSFILILVFLVLLIRLLYPPGRRSGSRR